MEHFEGTGETKAVACFREDTKPLILNKTNWNTIVKLHGDESDNWSGCEIELYPTLVSFKGDEVEAIRIRAPQAASSGSLEEEAQRVF